MRGAAFTYCLLKNNNSRKSTSTTTLTVLSFCTTNILDKNSSSSSNNNNDKEKSCYSLLRRKSLTCNNTMRLYWRRATTAAILMTSTTSNTSSCSCAAFSTSNTNSNNNNVFGTSKSALSSASSSTCAANARFASLKQQADPPLTKLPLDNSWPRMLQPELPENEAKSKLAERLSVENDDNRTRRQVFNGHFVIVEPTGIRNPRLVLFSEDVAANLLQLNVPNQVLTQDFVNFVSGNLVLQETWATPYALSIMGTKYINNCPFGTGNGYGDGRAISIAELNGHELQLKGGGKTPFARGADGRAVFRSSLREFLASEAMHHLGISTTRALSLVLSEPPNGDTVMRPWYSDDMKLTIPDIDDPRIARYSMEQRKQLLRQLRNQKVDPNIMITEQCAITCRVAKSFVRIGHLDLFARRVDRKLQQYYEAQEQQIMDDDNDNENDDDDDDSSSGNSNNYYHITDTLEYQELQDMVWHACYREFKQDAYDPYHQEGDIQAAAKVLLQRSAEGLADMIAGWIRVGFVQGNFNADNCLVGGRTMDYGPFGFVEEYSPIYAKWTGSGTHFGFLNQPAAGLANYQVLVESLLPILLVSNNSNDKEDNMGAATLDDDKILEDYMRKAHALFQAKVDETFRLKLGLHSDSDFGDDLWESLEPLLRKSRVDWTLFWRQLSYVLREFPDLDCTDYQAMLATLQGEPRQDEPHRDHQGDGDDDDDMGLLEHKELNPFYEPLTDEQTEEWLTFLESWRSTLQASHVDPQAAYQQMIHMNPKFVLREWMLVNAYTAAQDKNDEGEIHDLYELIQHPYEDGTSEQCRKYYRRAPADALTAGGVAFMS